MKTTVFTGAQMAVQSYDSSEYVATVDVPTLSAYAIEYAEFTPPRDVDAGYHLFPSGQEFNIADEKICFSTGLSLKFGGFESCRLVIHYHGIRDHGLLFPQVTEPKLQARLGQFYEEADAAFERGAWLSFALMSAAVYEGLLGWKLQASQDKLFKLVDTALKNVIIDARESRILHTARKHRNLVHASRYTDQWVQRAAAMDMRTTLDGLIRKLSRGGQ
jgi:hypothetical protein